MRCADMVRAIMIETIQNAMDSEPVSRIINVFPSLGKAIATVAEDLIKEQTKIAKEKISDYIDMQATFVKCFTLDFQQSLVELLTKNLDASQPVATPSLIFNASDGPVALVEPGSNPEVRSQFRLHQLKEKVTRKLESTPYNNSKKYILVKDMVREYFKEKRRNLQNYVPGSLAHNVIYYAQKELQMELVRKIYQRFILKVSELNEV